MEVFALLDGGWKENERRRQTYTKAGWIGMEKFYGVWAFGSNLLGRGNGFDLTHSGMIPEREVII